MTRREEEAKDNLQNIAKEIEAMLPEQFGFALLAYEFGEGDNREMLYVSNSKRPDIVEAMKEFINQNKGERHAK